MNGPYKWGSPVAHDPAPAHRCGPPEGWPEGADAEGAELTCAREVTADPGSWQLWMGSGWLNADCCDGFRNDKVAPGAHVVARRKPKPVTRDVLAWDLEPGMKVGSGVLWSVCREPGRKVSVVFMGDDTPLRYAADLPFSVLVEEPNG